MNSLKRHLWQKKIMKLKYGLVCLLGMNRVEYLRKHKVFAEIGNKVLFQPIKLPNEPKLIKIHDNVKIASEVTFYTHDVINSVFSTKMGGEFQTHGACIEIFDNVFVGGHSIIVGNVSIGPNSIIGAGSVITHDVPEGTIVAGNPARIVGSFSELYDKRRNLEEGTCGWDPNLRDKELWEQFYSDRRG